MVSLILAIDFLTRNKLKALLRNFRVGVIFTTGKLIRRAVRLGLFVVVVVAVVIILFTSCFISLEVVKVICSEELSCSGFNREVTRMVFMVRRCITC